MRSPLPAPRTLDLECFGGPYDGTILTVPAWKRDVCVKQFESSDCTHVYGVQLDDTQSRYLRYEGIYFTVAS